MSTDITRAAMAKAFRETTLSLIGLFQIYEVDPDLNEATAEVLGKVFRKHIQAAPTIADNDRMSPLHTLVDELECAGDDDDHVRKRRCRTTR